MPASLYDDVDKAARDLLNDDFKFDRKLKIKSKTSNGVSFTSDTTMSGEGSSRAVLSKVSAKFNHKSGFNVDKLEVSTHGRVVGEASMGGVADGLTLTLKAHDGTQSNSAGKKYSPYGRLGAEYVSDRVSATAELDVVNGPTLCGSALFAHENFVAGGEVTMNTHYDDEGVSPSLDNYGFTLGYRAQDFNATVRFGDFLDTWQASFNHQCDKDTKFGAMLSYKVSDESKNLAVGAQRKLCSDTTVKGRVNKDGFVGLAYNQTLNSKVSLSTAAQIDALNFSADNHKFGMAVTFNL